MSEVGTLICGVDNTYVQSILQELEAIGYQSTVLNLSAISTAAFDARPLEDYKCEGITQVQQMIETTQGLIIAMQSTESGCPGTLLNILQILGGAIYDHPQNALPLRDRAVVLLVTGPHSQAFTALEQGQTLIEALGASIIATTHMDQPDALPPTIIAQRLLTGPFAKQEYTLPNRKPIDLGLGHIHFPPPKAVQSTVASMGSDVSVYPPMGGIPALRKALVRHLRNQMLPIPDSSQLIVTSGGSMGLYTSLAAHLHPGDGVLIPNPGFPNFRRIAETLQARILPYTLQAKNDFLPDREELAQLAPQAKAIIWNFPHNPLGSIAPLDLTEWLVDLAHTYDLLIISDEVYTDLAWTGTCVSPAAMGASERTCVIGSFSKVCAMAGYRVGWVLAPSKLTTQIARIHWGIAMSTSLVSQHAAVSALQAWPEYLPELRGQLLHTRAAVLDQAIQSGIPCHVPDAAFYLWIDITATGLDDVTFAQRLSQTEQVEVMPGSVFGSQGIGKIRISFAAPQEFVLDGLKRLIRHYNRYISNATPVVSLSNNTRE